MIEGMTREEVEASIKRDLDEINTQARKVFCPLIGKKCNTDCVCLLMPSIYTTSKLDEDGNRVTVFRTDGSRICTCVALHGQ